LGCEQEKQGWFPLAGQIKTFQFRIHSFIVIFAPS
jgi:hypothetical protein